MVQIPNGNSSRKALKEYLVRHLSAAPEMLTHPALSFFGPEGACDPGAEAADQPDSLHRLHLVTDSIETNRPYAPTGVRPDGGLDKMADAQCSPSQMFGGSGRCGSTWGHNTDRRDNRLIFERTGHEPRTAFDSHTRR
jgi:hypothetical protein